VSLEIYFIKIEAYNDSHIAKLVVIK